MTLDTLISDVRTWLMMHQVSSENVILCVLIAAALALFLLKFFRPPKV